MKFLHARTTCSVLAAALLAAGLTACAPVVLGGGAVMGTLMATDRRTTGTQVEDEGIENKVSGRLKDVMNGRGHFNVTSFNRQVLLTGEVPTVEESQKAEKEARAVENVKTVVNELGVMENSGFSQRSRDTLITGKVKASLVDAKDLSSNVFKVVTERDVVYLMGRVTPREAKRSAEIARGVDNVRKVVRVFEVISEDELANYSKQQGAPVQDAGSTGTSSSGTVTPAPLAAEPAAPSGPSRTEIQGTPLPAIQTAPVR
ncbi:BON domain-containing protein [Diaphorobacter sp. HDW4A]|uniref:BON domain-containing protein n=1 Tax=Diaphorobacter sp. HDW4A TaxID=2714924 RepID=UPI00140D5DCB|nr:BON domain-containing protein [Diaphorobacter sp. HDW4A]QIL82020.1 BON domain-containing protein [Diaphorobacter sp. HDW4A]